MHDTVFDTGQRAKISNDPYSITYQCAGCKQYVDDCERISEWDGEGYRTVRVCPDCIERFV